ncbi:hypothetical protein DD238_002077 [Peronospora effusa]|uniref:Uncharacterized protein n=1 Tax=Peronospora effusa TaxID=542832 RepID=A0A3M6VR07_9STRA|nr:hypothetical protein DD238_002077 [Peronospora effusa]
MNDFSDVAAMFSSKHSARILLQHRSSVCSVDGDTEARSLSDVEIDRDLSCKKDKSLMPGVALNQHVNVVTTSLSLEEVERQLAELDNAPVITKEEINDMLAEQLDEFESSDSDDSIDSSSSNESEKVIMKVLIIGNARCGKTSTIRRFTEDEFHEEYVSTIGADFVEKIIQYDDQLSLSLQLWDIAGQDRFAKFTRGYFREAKGAVIVCDITRANTLDAVVNWKKEIDTCCKDLNQGTEIPVVMIANKSDLLIDPMGALDLGVSMQKCVDKNNIVEWFRASAKSGEHIDDAFRCLIDCMVENHRAEKEKEKEMEMEKKKEKEKIDDDTAKKEESPAPEIIRLSRMPHQHRAVKQHGVACDCN